jgi:hypothetical protein
MVNQVKLIPPHNRLAQGLRRLLQLEYLPVTILIIVNLIIGLSTNHYGTGWDDFPFTFPHGENSLSSYRTVLLDRSGDYYCSYLISKDCYYGPAYFVLVTILTKITQALLPVIKSPDIWHAMNFFVFNLGIYFLYVLARSWLSRWASFSVALLFAVQPLLRGQGFINPKDAPFMVFFLGSITAGLAMVETWAGNVHRDEKIYDPRSWSEMMHVLSFVDLRKKRVLVGVFLFFITLFTLAIIFLPVIESSAEILIGFFYDAPPTTWESALFDRIAPNANHIPITNYVEKFIRVFIRGSVLFIIFMTALTLGVFSYWLRAPLSTMLSSFGRLTLDTFKLRQLWFASMAIGFTTGIRVLGPYAGVIVLVYMLIRSGKRSLPLILPYATVSFFFIYLFWPFLWKSPVERFLQTLLLMSDYPPVTNVLFNGTFYSSTNLPVMYLPILLSIQLTEPVIVLAAIGIVLLFLKSRQSNYFQLLILISLWFFIPLVGVMIVRPTLYDNFRQFLFFVPPIFLLVGMSMELILNSLNQNIVRVLILATFIAPAVYMNIKLYPYEYVYYNSFVGGTKGAFRKFEMDYWLTAYREAAETISKNENVGAQMIFLPPDMSVFVENNLSLYQGDCTSQPLYAAISSRWNGDKTEYETASIAYTISRDEAVLMVIRRLSCPPPLP